MTDEAPGGDDVDATWETTEATTAGPAPAPWAVEVVRSLTWTRLASKIAGWLAVVGGVAGVGVAVMYLLQEGSGSDLLGVQNLAFRWGPALTALLTTTFYVGLLVAASALLRLQAARLEAEVFGEEPDDDGPR